MKQKILVVDDEPEAVELVEFNLKQAGFDVTTDGFVVQLGVGLFGPGPSRP